MANLIPDQPLTETYYAIRIGDPKKHRTYFMRGDESTPLLFVGAAKADTMASSVPDWTVVKVEVREIV